MKNFLGALGLAAGLSACLPGGLAVQQRAESVSRGNAEAAVSEPTTRSNDRPTETGAGVPGYLVNCSEITEKDAELQVACNVANLDGQRVPSEDKLWTYYDIQLPSGISPAIRVDKSQAAELQLWDVFFTFTGAPLAELRKAAHASTYEFSRDGARGASSQAGAAEDTSVSAAPPQSNQACPNGVVVSGICIVSVASSCSAYCDQAQLKVHPMVVASFGSGAASNREACREIYGKLDQPTFPFSNLMVNDVTTGRGLGCYRKANGFIFFDGTPTDPAAAPFFGDSRICACQ